MGSSSQILDQRVCAHALLQFCLQQSCRHHRRKPKAHPRHDLDTHPALYYRGHQVRHLRSAVQAACSECQSAIHEAKKACRPRKACFSGVSVRQPPTKNATSKTSPTAGLTALLCMYAPFWISMSDEVHRALGVLLFIVIDPTSSTTTNWTR